MKDDFNSLVGTAEAKLRRIKDRTTKAEILSSVQEGNLSPEQRLRGYLVTGQTPPTDLLSENIISNAMQIADRITFLPSLSRKFSTLYADEVMDSILAYLAKFRSAKTE